MPAEEEEANPYELLGVGLEATEGEIKTAYRQRSLKVHPDRVRLCPPPCLEPCPLILAVLLLEPRKSRCRCVGPFAVTFCFGLTRNVARKFHELNQAYELLLDPLRRMALDAKVRLKEARKARYSQYDAKRKNMLDDLEERERAFKKAKTDQAEKQKEVFRENEKIMEEGRILREARQKELAKKMQEAEDGERRKKQADADSFEPPTLGAFDYPSCQLIQLIAIVGALDTTVKVKYQLSARPNLKTAADIRGLLSQFGAVEEPEIVISLKPAPPKKAKRGIALVPFKQIGDAFGAVGASGLAQRGLQDVEVTWAGDKEPELIGWLKKMGQLGTKRSLTPQVSQEDVEMRDPSLPNLNAPSAKGPSAGH